MFMLRLNVLFYTSGTSTSIFNPETVKTLLVDPFANLWFTFGHRLLNDNNIASIDMDTFAGLANLNLLSLYDNSIRTIPEKTFDPLEKLQTMHLGKNPFNCDCNLLWMTGYLQRHPVETSGAVCETPSRFFKKSITDLEYNSTECKDGPEMRSSLADKDDLYLDDHSEALADANVGQSSKLSLLACQKGRCIPFDSMNYECSCRNGFGGPFCEQPPTCRKEESKEYHEENGCRSKKKVRVAECVGSCGNQCCTATKTRERPVRMVCPDGKIYTKTIEVIEKCACDRTCSWISLIDIPPLLTRFYESHSSFTSVLPFFVWSCMCQVVMTVFHFSNGKIVKIFAVWIYHFTSFSFIHIYSIKHVSDARCF